MKHFLLSSNNKLIWFCNGGNEKAACSGGTNGSLYVLYNTSIVSLDLD